MQPLTPEKEQELVDLLVYLRKLMAEEFPIKDSVICHDVVLEIIQAHLRNEKMMFKQFYALFPYSEIGIRNQLVRLAGENWIRLDRSTENLRSKIIQAEPKLIEAWERVCSRLDETYAPDNLGRLRAEPEED